MSWRIQGQCLRVKATISRDMVIGEIVEISPDFTFTDTISEENRFFGLAEAAKAGDKYVTIQVPEVHKLKVDNAANIQGGSALGRSGNGVKLWSSGTILGYALGAPDKDGCIPVVSQNYGTYTY